MCFVMRHRLVSSVIWWITLSNTKPYLSYFEILFILIIIINCFLDSFIYWPFIAPPLSNISSSPCLHPVPSFLYHFKNRRRVRHLSILVWKLIQICIAALYTPLPTHICIHILLVFQLWRYLIYTFWQLLVINHSTL